MFSETVSQHARRLVGAVAAIALTVMSIAMVSSPAAAFQANVTTNTIATGNYRSNGTPSTTLVMTTTVAAPANSMIVVTGSANNTGISVPTFTVTNSAGDVFTTRVQGCGGPTTADGGVCGFIATAPSTNGLPVGGTITTTLSNATIRIATVAQFFTGVSGSVIRGSAGAGTGATTSTAASVSVAGALAGDIVIGSASVEDGSNTITPDTDTLNGTWSVNTVSSTNNGAGATEVYVSTQYKTTTAAGTQSFDNTTINTDNYTMAIVLARLATPGAVTNLTATPGDTQMALSWTAAPANDAPITDYIVEYSTNGGTNWTAFADGTSPNTTATVTGLTNGTAYLFRVTPVNAVGTSDIVQPTVAGTPRTVPGAPTAVGGTFGNTQVSLAWTAPANNGGAAISDYVIEYSANGGTNWTVFADGTSTTAATTVTGLTNGTGYIFRVSAVNVAGTGAASTNSASVTPRTTPSQAAAPTATPGNGQVALSWTAPNNGGDAITDYVIEYSANAGTDWTTFADGTSTTPSATVTGLTNGTGYIFRVSAVNTVGTGAVSASSLTTTPRTTPSAPAAPTATAAANGSMTISWAAPFNGGATITGYTVIDQNSNIVCTSATTSCTVSSLTPGSSYTFRVTATNVAGTSAASPASTSTEQIKAPEAPGSIVVLSGRYRFIVDWAAANGNSYSVTGYTATATWNGNSYSCTTTTETRCVIENLPIAQRTYAVSVTANNQNGTGAASSAINMITWYNPRTPSQIDLTGADLAGLNLSFVNFSTANLTGVDFGSANLTGAFMKNVTISGAKLGSATITGLVSDALTGAPASLPAGYSVIGGNVFGPGVNLWGMTLTNRDVSGVNLTGANLGSANLSGSNLAGANLSKVLAQNSNLSSAALTAANLTNANLSGANVASTGLASATLTGVRTGSITGTPESLPSGFAKRGGHLVGPGANLYQAALAGEDLSGMNLSTANMTGANLNGANLNGANLTRTNATNANLASATVTSANMTGAVISGADVSGASFASTILTGVKAISLTGNPSLPTGYQRINGHIVGPGVNLVGAHLGGHNFSGIDFTGANLSGANASGTNFTGANLTRVTATNVDFTGATLTNANMTSMNVTGANLTNVNLASATMVSIKSASVTGTPVMPSGWAVRNGYLVGSRAYLVGANLANQDLSGLNLASTSLASANLTNANLSSANLTGTALGTATLTGATGSGIVGKPGSLPSGWSVVLGVLTKK